MLFNKTRNMRTVSKLAWANRRAERQTRYAPCHDHRRIFRPRCSVAKGMRRPRQHSRAGKSARSKEYLTPIMQEITTPHTAIQDCDMASRSLANFGLRTLAFNAVAIFRVRATV